MSTLCFNRFMPRRTKDEAQQTRKLLLRVARDLAAARGFEGLSLEEVATAAEVTRGAVYHHFGSKEGLFRDLAVERLEWMGSRIEAVATEAGDDWSGLVAGCLAFLRDSQEPAYRRIVMLDAPAVLGPRAWRELDDRYTNAPLREVLGSLSESGVVRGLSPAATAEALSGAMIGLSLWVAAGSSLAEAEETLLRLLQALRAP